MLRKTWYTFSFGWAKTIPVRSGVFVWMDESKPDTLHRIRVDANMKYALHERIGIRVHVA